MEAATWTSATTERERSTEEEGSGERVKRRKEKLREGGRPRGRTPANLIPVST